MAFTNTQNRMPGKRKALLAGIAFFMLILLLALILYYYFNQKEKKPIPVGILHSLTGTMSRSERPVANATLLAISEINAKGGVLGRPIRPILMDGESDWPTFAKKAEELIVKEKVKVIFGCWTSASRKEVKPIVEKYQNVLFYPVQYEGLESSPNIIYIGATANEQIIPAVRWSLQNLGKRFYLVGSDYVFPRTANEIIKDVVMALEGEIVGEKYVPLGGEDFEAIIVDIKKTNPTVILNTINGDSNIAFYRSLRAANITPERVPTVLFSVAEVELRELGVPEMVGDYAVWNYFQSIKTAENKKFISAYHTQFGESTVLDDPMEGAYIGVQLWAQAAEAAGSVETEQVLVAINNQSIQAPEGIVAIDSRNHHAWKNVHVGKIRSDGQFDIIWSTKNPVEPEPYPRFRPKFVWESFLQDLYASFGNQWAKPIEEIKK